MDKSRVIVYSPQGEYMKELPPDLVFERTRTEELNGEHSLNITTAIVLRKGQRLLTCDSTGEWREWVVLGEDAEHTSGKRAIGSYYCVWSMQYDLSGVTCTAMPGTQTPVTASSALQSLLSNTSRWQRGTVTQTSTGGASMWRKSAWEALGILTEVWGGEVGSSIETDGFGVVSRKVNLWSHEGSETVTRRFDYTRDLTEIRRKVSEDEVFARIIPLGKGEETEGGGYGRKIDISSVNGGVEWLENPEAAAAYRMPDGLGGYEYPTRYVENPDCETPQQLKDWGLAVLPEWTIPKASYTASVLQFAEAGMDVQGIGLGDEVHVVDRAFGGEAVRIQGRVLRLVTDELQPSNVTVTLGNLTEGLQDVFGELNASLSRTREVVQAINGGTMSTAEYLSRLIGRLNGEINSAGGYTYITQGQGLRTYDAAVSDPLVGAEASKVTEIKGGSIRFADSKTAQGEWEWETLIVSGHVAANLVTAANITAGFIGNASGGNFWDLDSGELRMAASTTKVEGQAINSYIGSLIPSPGAATAQEVFNELTSNGTLQGVYATDGSVYINASLIQSGTLNAARIGANSITADKINTSQLISPKVGNSADDYAEIGIINYQGQDFSGIKFTIDGSNDTLVLGVRDDQNIGTQVILAVGLPNGYGFYPLYYGTQGAVFLNALPTLWHNVYSSYGLIVDSQGLTFTNGQGTTRTISY